jgi:DNA-binding NtrC family response regulator
MNEASTQAKVPALSARHIMVVDDDDDMRRELARIFQKRGYQVTACRGADEAFELLKTQDCDVVVTDLNMKGMNGVDLCDRVVQNWRDLPVIVVTGFGSMETAVATLRAGAFDFITKPFHAENLALSVERALQHRSLKREVKRLRTEVSRLANGGSSAWGMVGESEKMRELFSMVGQLARTDVTVLITGESGAGKELVARAIHENSPRASAPLVAINCAAMPENLLESELFGHVKGAFTDAKVSKPGLMQEASEGTLFLDEVGEMPLAMQAKLLRALEERRVRPVGGDKEIEFNARIIAATNRDLEAMVAAKTFREDLYYRINVVHVDVPPLRHRGNDVLLIAAALIEKFAPRHGKGVRGISSAVASKLLGYGWPGNVRELANVIERAIALSQYEELTVEDLPAKIRDYASPYVFPGTGKATELVSMDEVEARYIRQVMEYTGYRKAEAARILGFDRSTLYRKLDRYKIEFPDA